MNPHAFHKWRPIDDLNAAPQELEAEELRSLSQVWHDQREEIEGAAGWPEFKEQLAREWSVETGLIERIYTLDRGVTEMLIERGLDAELPRGTTGKAPPAKAMAMIRDHKNVIDGLFDFVGGGREITASYIKQLHAELVRNQDTVTGFDAFDKPREMPLLMGDYKKRPNNPNRPDGNGIHEYCPPEHVVSEMERLLEIHARHINDKIAPEIAAAWLHHRFAQIHPFQDGNGRVARCLATLVFLRAGLFPLIVRDTNGERGRYIDALEKADGGDLKPLVGFFVACQRREISRAIAASHEVLRESQPEAIIRSATKKIAARRQRQRREWENAKRVAGALHAAANTRLNEIKRSLEEDASESGVAVFVTGDKGDDPENQGRHFRGQIVECAKKLGYYANPGIYHQWLQLAIRSSGNEQTEMLFSFHGIGREYRGVLACSARLFSREGTDIDEGNRVSAPIVLSPEAFQINYREPEDSTTRRFREWLNEALSNGLALWHQSL